MHLTFSNVIEQLIHNTIDWKLCREGNNQINLWLLSFNIQQFKFWYRVISSTDPRLFGAKTMKGQRVNRHIWSIGQFIWNFAESETIRAISACLLSIYAMMKGIWLWRWWWSESERINAWKNEQTKEWTYQWTNELRNQWKREGPLTAKKMFILGGSPPPHRLLSRLKKWTTII